MTKNSKFAKRIQTTYLKFFMVTFLLLSLKGLYVTIFQSRKTFPTKATWVKFTRNVSLSNRNIRRFFFDIHQPVLFEVIFIMISYTTIQETRKNLRSYLFTIKQLWETAKNCTICIGHLCSLNWFISVRPFACLDLVSWWWDILYSVPIF